MVRTLDRYLAELLDYTERLARAEMTAMPDGKYYFEDKLDDDGVNLKNEVTIRLTITVDGDELVYDFDGTDPQVASSMNNPLGSTRSAVVTAVRSMMGGDVPRNGGAWRPVTLNVPDGNPQQVDGTALSDVLLGCQCQIRPERMLACSSGVDTLLNIAGTDANGDRFILTECCWGGWGGRNTCDGIEFITPPSHNNSNTPIEISEQMYPAILYNCHEFVADTEGAGKFRGAVALRREWIYQGVKDGSQLRVSGPHCTYRNNQPE